MRFFALLVTCLFAPACGGCNHASARADVDAGDGGKLDAGDARAPAASSASSLAYDSGILDEQIPATTSEDLTTRTRHLLEAIAHDNPELGADMIFPRDAYVTARDAADPGRAWETKVHGLFVKQLHRLSKKKGIEQAQYVSFELGHSVTQSVPKKHEWKKPLWKVKHAKLTFTIEGKTHRLDIAEMTAWRGAWYVTRLQ
jgi:hypothetical protein